MTLYPFVVSFVATPRATRVQQWTRFYPSLQHAYRDAADAVRNEYPTAPLNAMHVTLAQGFYPLP